MVSSNLARRGHASRIFVAVNSPQAKESGLRLDSVIMTDNVATVLDGEIHSVLGRLQDMSAVDVALKYTLDLG